MKEILKKTKEMVCGELKELSSRGRIGGMVEVETLYKLTDVLKDICEIEEMYDEGGYSQSYGYSQDDGYSQNGDYSRNDSGHSYRRQPRDSRGRYSRNNGGHSYGESKEELFEILGGMMDGASEKERDAYRRLREEMRGA